jgi:hypothetical protein
MNSVFETAAEYLVKRHPARKHMLAILDDYLVSIHSPPKLVRIDGGAQRGGASEEERLLEARARDPDFMKLSRQIRLVEEALNALSYKERHVLLAMTTGERPESVMKKLKLSESTFWRIRRSAVSSVAKKLFRDWIDVEV